MGRNNPLPAAPAAGKKAAATKTTALQQAARAELPPPLPPQPPRLDICSEVESTAENAELERAFATILRCVDPDPSREGLRDTPARAAKALKFLTSGYGTGAGAAVGRATFVVEPAGPAAGPPSEPTSEPTAAPLGMVCVRDIEVHSLCEHHILPFFGRAHIAYLPGRGAVLGLSKLARIADVFARRLQMQVREIAVYIVSRRL